MACTRIFGFRPASRSWKIICISRRSGRSSAQASDVAPVKYDAPAARVGQAQDRAPDGGLAATGFPDQAYSLVFPEIKAHAVHRRDHALLAGQHRDQAATLTVVLAQIGDVKNSAAHALRAAGYNQQRTLWPGATSPSGGSRPAQFWRTASVTRLQRP